MTMRGRKPKPGRIMFVGSGPGDPGLLTTRARAVLANAALVFTDPDVPEQVLALVGSELAAGVRTRARTVSRRLPPSDGGQDPDGRAAGRRGGPAGSSRSAPTSGPRSVIPPRSPRSWRTRPGWAPTWSGWSPVTRCRWTRCSPRSTPSPRTQL